MSTISPTDISIPDSSYLELRKEILFPDNIYEDLGIDFFNVHIARFNDMTHRKICGDITVNMTTLDYTLNPKGVRVYHPLKDSCINLIRFPRIEHLAFPSNIVSYNSCEFFAEKSFISYEDFKAEVNKYLESISGVGRMKVVTHNGHPGVNFTRRTNKVLTGRSLDSIWIPEVKKHRIVSQIESFFSKDEMDFRFKHGIPHKKTYIFAGLPGTGKTSLVKALATYFNLSIYYVDMAEDIISKLSTIPPGYIVLIEDIDTIFNTLDGSSSDHAKMSVASFINALDGIDSPEGVITILTCNDTKIFHFPAIRRGRIDHIESFEKMDRTCIEGMIGSFFPDVDPARIKTIAAKIYPSGVVPSDLQHYILESRNSFDVFEKSMIGGYFKNSVSYFKDAHTHNESISTSYHHPGGFTGIM